MGLLSFFKKKPASNSTNSQNDSSHTALSKDEYKAIREEEHSWLEAHYDFSSVDSIISIPERKDLPRPPGKSPTGEVYYYLRYKARIYEQAGECDLALACMKKSITLMQIKYGNSYGKNECYSYLRMLMRCGHSDKVQSLKEEFDLYYDNSLDQMRLRSFQATLKNASELKTDLLIMSVSGSTCPECAKYQGRIYSISGKAKKFPPLPAVVKETGIIHPGCHHCFFPYIHKVTKPNMDYTLSVHPLQNPRYGKDIVTFSNRPFVDDRTEECKQTALAAIEKRRQVKLNKQRRDELVFERIQKQQSDYADYEWLKTNFPEKCPATASGYRRMKTQNTKNYLILKKLASDLGREI